MADRPIFNKTFNTIAAWNFDEGSGTVANDSSGNFHTGTINSATYTASSKFGNSALSFLAANTAFVDCGSIASPAQGTAAAWIASNGNYAPTRLAVTCGLSAAGSDQDTRFAIFATNQSLIATQDWVVEIGNGTLPSQFVDSGELYNSTNFPSGVYVHLAFTFDGSTITLYRNGNIVKSVAQTISAVGVAQPFAIGRAGGFNGFYYEGSIDEVRLYSRALLPSEIKNLMLGYEPSPVSIDTRNITGIRNGYFEGGTNNAILS